MSCVQLSEDGFQQVYPHGIWSGIQRVPVRMWLLNYLYWP